MKLVILLAIIGFFFTQTVFGQADSEREQTYEPTKLKLIYDSKYIATTEIVLRDSDGNLISITNANAFRYLDDPIVDEFLEAYEIIDVIEKDGKKYELRQMILLENHGEDSYPYSFISYFQLIVNDTETIEIFRASHHGFAIKSGDVSTITWSILRQVS